MSDEARDPCARHTRARRRIVAHDAGQLALHDGLQRAERGRVRLRRDEGVDVADGEAHVRQDGAGVCEGERLACREDAFADRVEEAGDGGVGGDGLDEDSDVGGEGRGVRGVRGDDGGEGAADGAFEGGQGGEVDFRGDDGVQDGEEAGDFAEEGGRVGERVVDGVGLDAGDEVATEARGVGVAGDVAEEREHVVGERAGGGGGHCGYGGGGAGGDGDGFLAEAERGEEGERCEDEGLHVWGYRGLRVKSGE